jgi:hypothetical protein
VRRKQNSTKPKLFQSRKEPQTTEENKLEVFIANDDYPERFGIVWTDLSYSLKRKIDWSNPYVEYCRAIRQITSQAAFLREKSQK